MLRNYPIEWPSIRRFLLQVHEDLLEIDRKTLIFIGEDKLTLVEEMILILEDRRFFHHFGLDFPSVLREVLRAVLLRKHGGASTIDMQWVRTVTEYREMTLTRKIYEVFLAIIIQQRYDKWTIFRSYMDHAYLGTRIKGVEEASQKVFGKDSSALTVPEAAEIAAMFVYPRPSVITPRWSFKLERRKRYAEIRYPRYKKSLEKLPRSKIL